MRLLLAWLLVLSLPGVVSGEDPPPGRSSDASWTAAPPPREEMAQLEAQRRVDMARVAAGLSYLDGQHGQQVARTNELMSYVLDAAGEGPHR